MDDTQLQEKIEEVGRELHLVRTEIGRRLIGQAGVVDGMLSAIITGGHVLIEGVPGLAKTLAVKTFAEILSVDFKRIQFTPDLLPADLIGTMIYRPETGEFVPRKGPIFCNVVLGDEINRAPAKVQSALLEAMAEGQVTLGETTYILPFPFFVLATQNPIEQEGTYALPEAQLDRFMLKLLMDYPSEEDELSVLRRMGEEKPIPVKKLLDPERMRRLQNTSSLIRVDERIEKYIVSLVRATREGNKTRYDYAKYIEFGASTRAILYIYRCAKVQALFNRRSFVIPDDVKAVAPAVLRHRLVLSYEAESEGLSADDIIRAILGTVAVP